MTRAAGFFCFLAIASAQVDTGVLTGVVSDKTGGVMPGVKVTIVNAGTNARVELLSDGSGIFVSPPLPPGNYRVEASLTGFRTAVFSREAAPYRRAFRPLVA